MEASDDERPLLCHRHQPTRSTKNGGSNWRASVLIILCTELAECMAFAGIARNLVSYLTGALGETNANAARDVSAWTGTCFLTPLLGAFLADSYWGRRATIVVFLSVYMLGMLTLTVSAASGGGGGDVVLRRATVYLGLYLVALGVGGVKPCAAPLGAEQFDDDDEDAPAGRASFFNWYYFCVNVGALLAATVLVWVQDSVGWWLGFGIPAATMALALGVFVVGSRLCGLRTARKPPAGSPFTRLCQVVVAAVRKRCVDVPGDHSLLHHDEEAIVEHTDQFTFLDKAAVVVDDDATSPASPWRLCTVAQVEELKALLRLSTVWPTVVFFFAVTAQMSSTFVEQGAAMDNRVGPFAVPPAALSVFEVVSILLCVPAYDALVVPLARRATGHADGITQLQRLGVGLALSALAMAYAALLEATRRRASPPTSIMWQAPSYVVLGAAEVFTSVGLLEFFYSQAPDAMKSMCTAVSLVAVAAGSYLNSAMVAVVSWATAQDGGGGGWIADDLDQGRLDCFFWLMAGLSCVNLVAFVFSSLRYTYKDATH